MPSYQFLTDRTLVQSTAITPTTLIHVVYTGDTSQNPAGSSYKAELQQLSTIFSGSPFTGNTSGNCISDLYVTNIRSCSPLNINPSNEGNVYVGSAAVTIDTTSLRLGIRTALPSKTLDVNGTAKVVGSYSPITPSMTMGANDEIGFYNETVSKVDNIKFLSTGGSSQLKLNNGLTSPNLLTTISQFNVFSAIETNTSSASTTAPFYIVNNSDGIISFRTNVTEDVLYLLPTGDTLSVFSATNLANAFVKNYIEAENMALRNVGTSAFVNDIRIDNEGKFTTNTSDERLKENVKPITNGLNTILELSGVTYQWKDRKAGGNEERFGFIAQQVESTEPKLTFTNKVDGYKGVHIDAVIPLLVEAVKEQQFMIEELREKIKKLETPT